jgi:RNA polymerase sigma factor for flagellar operon FliA
MTAYTESVFSEKQKEELTKEFIPRIKAWVLRIHGTLPDSVDVDDLFSAACMGFVESLNRYDKSKNVEFYSYAERRIKGAILDALRQMDFLPRNLRNKVKDLESKIADISSKLGRRPTVEEISEHTGVDTEDIYKLLSVIENGNIASLDASAGEDSDSTLIDFIKSNFATPDENIEKEELVNTLGAAIEGLSEKERMVVTLYYYEELTMKEVGSVLDITESRISQIHSSAMKKLQRKLEDIV